MADDSKDGEEKAPASAEEQKKPEADQASKDTKEDKKDKSKESEAPRRSEGQRTAPPASSGIPPTMMYILVALGAMFVYRFAAEMGGEIQGAGSSESGHQMEKELSKAQPGAGPAQRKFNLNKDQVHIEYCAS